MHPEDARSMRTGADTCEAMRGADQRVGVCRRSRSWGTNACCQGSRSSCTCREFLAMEDVGVEGGPDAGPMASPTQARQELPQRTRPRQTRDAKGPHGRGRPSRAHSAEARSMRHGTDTFEATRGVTLRDVEEPAPMTKEVEEPMPRNSSRPITRLKNQSHSSYRASSR